MKKNNQKTQVALTILFTVLCILVVYPFLLLIGISLSNEMDVAEFGYRLIPKNLDFSAYMYIFKNPRAILNAYKVTTIFSVVGTCLSVMLISMIAYPLSKKGLRGKNGITFYLYFTMLFNGGMVSTYIVITQFLHLSNSIWVYILPGLISPWFVFMVRTFFQGLPYEISESAKIDGASEYKIYFRIILPLSKPVLATTALMTFLAKWNLWYESMLYINNDDLISLQYLLQKIMQNIQMLQDASNNMNISSMLSASKIPAETVRMAMAVVVAGPVIAIFPFFQKYFIKGLTVGSVKG